jgi:RNA polymerase sigma-70 factor (ECF subfamily)
MQTSKKPCLYRLLPCPIGIIFNTLSPKRQTESIGTAWDTSLCIGLNPVKFSEFRKMNRFPYTSGEPTRAQQDPQRKFFSPRMRMPHSSPPIKPSDPPSETSDGKISSRAAAAGVGPPTPAIPAQDDTLTRAQNGDHQAFAQLYSLHKRRIYSLCLRMVGNTAEAEDLTQEAFLQLHRKIATFRGDSAFSTWMHRLAINVVLMHLRRKGLALISLDEAMDPTPEEGPGRSFGSPDLNLTGAIDRLALERAVSDLPAGYRLIFVLHDIEGYEHNEIASMLDCSIGNSKSQLHKARLKLRDTLRNSTRQETKK